MGVQRQEEEVSLWSAGLPQKSYMGFYVDMGPISFLGN